MPFVDIALDESGNKGFPDFEFVNGDFKTVEGFEMALLMSVLCERRAEPSEVSAPERRRGWWGNEALDFENYNIGSKLWLLFQARSTQQTLNNAITYVRQGLQWMIEDNFLEDVNVTAEYKQIKTEKVLEIMVFLIRSQNSVETRGFRLWQNTERIEIIGC